MTVTQFQTLVTLLERIARALEASLLDIVRPCVFCGVGTRNSVDSKSVCLPCSRTHTGAELADK